MEAQERCRIRVLKHVLRFAAKGSAAAHSAMMSRRHGIGIEFASLRDYVFGDDIRFVDWRATARRPDPHLGFKMVVREFVEERAPRALLLVVASRGLIFWDKVDTLAAILSAFTVPVLRLGLEATIALAHADGLKLHRIRNVRDIIEYLPRIVCEAVSNEPRSETLQHIGALLKSYGRPDLAVIATDFSLPKGLYRFIASTMVAVGAEPIAILVASRYEVEAPHRELARAPVLASGALVELENLLATAKLYHEEVDAMLRAIGVRVVRVYGLSEAEEKALSIARMAAYGWRQGL